MSTKKAVLTVLGCVALAATPVAAIAAQDRSPQPQGSGAPDGLIEAIQEVPPSLQDSFGVLREQPSPRETSGGKTSAPGGINRELGATIRTDVAPVTIVPGSDVVCVEIPTRGGRAGSCAPLEYVLKGKLSLSVRRSPGGPGIFVGLVPDGVSEVQLSGPSGDQSDSVAVHDNVWIVADSTATQVTFKSDDGDTDSVLTLRR